MKTLGRSRASCGIGVCHIPCGRQRTCLSPELVWGDKRGRRG